MIDYTALHNELVQDPLGLGYGPLVSAGNDTGLVALLNAATGPGTATIALQTVDRDTFLLALRPAYLSLPGLSALIQQKWDRVLVAINTSPRVVIDSTTQTLLSMAVSDGVLTQAQADAAWHRTGSRAEVLLGAGTVITLSDVSFALRGVR